MHSYPPKKKKKEEKEKEKGLTCGLVLDRLEKSGREEKRGGICACLQGEDEIPRPLSRSIGYLRIDPLRWVCSRIQLQEMFGTGLHPGW